MPDYTKGINIPYNTKYTTEFDCFVTVYAFSSSSYEYCLSRLFVYDAAGNELWANGNRCISTDGMYHISSVTGFFKKGTIIYCEVYGSAEVRAYPLI